MKPHVYLVRLLSCLLRSIVHGTHDTVNRICDHPDIEAISFVGSNAAGQYIYERGSRSGKRIQVGSTC